MKASTFLSTRSVYPVPLELDLPSFVERFLVGLPDDGRPKDQYPLWSPASYAPGTRRAKRSVVDVCALVADVDDGTPIETALKRLRRQTPALAIFHTSYSHSPTNHPKYRVILPLAEPIPVEDFSRAWHWLAEVLGCVDHAAKDASRMYFEPVARPGFAAFVDDGPLLRPPNAPERTWRDLPDPDLRTPLVPPPDWRPTFERPAWAPSPHDYPPTTVALALERWHVRLGEATALVEPLTEGRRTAIRSAAFRLARYLWLDETGDLAGELVRAFADAAAKNARLDENILTLLESCVADAVDTPAPIEDLALTAPGVAPPYIIKFRSNVYFVRNDGTGPTGGQLYRYKGPVDAKGLIPYVRDRGDLPYTGESGAPWSVDRLLDRHGANATGLEFAYPRADGTIPRVWDTETGTLRITRAHAPTVAAVEHPTVAAWLDLLLPEGPLGDLVRDWLATVHLLDAPSSALYLEGPPGTGKSLLAGALASPWRVPPIPLDTAIGTYPMPLATCPIVHLEEGTDLDARGTARFRILVSERAFELNEKYLPAATLRSALRVMISANNADALGIREIRSLADLDAIAERVLHVMVRGEAARYLAAVGTDDWVSRRDGSPGLVAEHVAWLAATRTVTPGNRYVVPGVRTEWHDSLLWRVPAYAAVLGGIVAGLVTRPEAAFHRGDDDTIRVSVTRLHGRWNALVLEDMPKPTANSLLKTLAALSRTSPEPGVFAVDARVVEAYARALGAPLDGDSSAASNRGGYTPAAGGYRRSTNSAPVG